MFNHETNQKVIFMKALKIFSIIGLLIVSFTAVAVTEAPQQQQKPFHPPFVPLDKVSYQVAAEQWATTDTALVTIKVNATVKEQNLANVQQQVLTNLSKLNNNAQWHITQFDRNQNQSGLEQVSIAAQARISESQLGDIRSQLKSVSKPGESYDLANIAYVPSLAEIEKVRADLRQQIYSQAKDELARLSKVYPNQKFVLYRINFMPLAARPTPRMMTTVRLEKREQSTAEPMTVSNKVTMVANVVLATNN